MFDSLPNLITSHDYYTRSFNTFLQATDKGLSSKVWLAENIAKLVEKKEELSVLSVGCGNGEIDLHLIRNTLLSLCQNITYHALEPNPNRFTAFTEAIDSSFTATQVELENSLQFIVPNITFQLFQTKFEDFTLPTTIQNYDLVLCIHSMYFVRPLTPSLRRMIDFLTPSTGLLVIDNASPGGTCQFPLLAGIKSADGYTLTSTNILQTIYSLYPLDIDFRSSWAPRLLSRHSLVQANLYNTFIDVSCILKEESTEMDAQAELLLAFFAKKVLTTATEQQKAILRNLLRSMSVKGPDNRWLFWNANCFITFKTPAQLLKYDSN
ncbi:hypothetical protein K7432_010690 [Basidiobolus ranarum]|uniref:Methyltransferase domain-containing protein n=1 Tax=Basidiobolus ranarum TaxID=34480 RepID=A0ABR2WNE4_9FUNG